MHSLATSKRVVVLLLACRALRHCRDGVVTVGVLAAMCVARFPAEGRYRCRSIMGEWPSTITLASPHPRPMRDLSECGEANATRSSVVPIPWMVCFVLLPVVIAERVLPFLEIARANLCPEQRGVRAVHAPLARFGCGDFKMVPA